MRIIELLCAHSVALDKFIRVAIGKYQESFLIDAHGGPHPLKTPKEKNFDPKSFPST